MLFLESPALLRIVLIVFGLVPIDSSAADVMLDSSANTQADKGNPPLIRTELP